MRVHFDGLRRPARVAKALRSELEALGVTIGLGKAQDITALAYGYASYRELQSTVGQRPADPWDEDAPPEVASARRKRQADAFASAGVTRDQAEALVAAIGPSTRQAGKGRTKAPPVPSRNPAMPEIEMERRSSLQDDHRTMSRLVAADPSRDGPNAVLLENGWLLCCFTSKVTHHQAVEAWYARRGDRPLPTRVLYEEWSVVAAFKAGIDDEAGGSKDIGNPAARRMLREILAGAARHGVSEVAIAHEAGDTRGRFWVNGAMRRAVELTPVAAAALCREAFALSDSVDSSYRPNSLQAGRLSVRSGALPEGIQFARLQWVPLPEGGRQLSIRLFEAHPVGRDAAASLAACGYGEAAASAIERMRRRPSGLNIVAGPAISGKSRSIAAILSADLDRRRVAAIDDGTGPAIPWATQVVVDRNAATADERKEARRAAIDAAMEGNPDVLAIGEIADFATASLAFKAAMSGLQVWATVRATDAITALSRLRDLGIESYRIHDPRLVTGLVGQRLVRVTCPSCSIGYDEALREGFLDPGTRASLDRFAKGRKPHRMRFANPDGCPRCTDGYRGQRLVAEAILPDREFMADLADGNPRKDGTSHTGAGSFASMLAEAVTLAVGGEIDVREVEDRIGFLDDLDDGQAARIHDATRSAWLGGDGQGTAEPEVTAA